MKLNNLREIAGGDPSKAIEILRNSSIWPGDDNYLTFNAFFNRYPADALALIYSGGEEIIDLIIQKPGYMETAGTQIIDIAGEHLPYGLWLIDQLRARGEETELGALAYTINYYENHGGHPKIPWDILGVLKQRLLDYGIDVHHANNPTDIEGVWAGDASSSPMTLIDKFKTLAEFFSSNGGTRAGPGIILSVWTAGNL